ncbi:MAG: SOS response-associated peptidase family protein [Polaromonas sp.]
MCSHYQSVKSSPRLKQVFGVESPPDVKADVWPGYASIFIRRSRESASGDAAAFAREAMSGVFGMIPHWAKDEKSARRTYNARSETVAEKPGFRDAWRLGRHCIIPAEAFFEPDWRTGKAVATRINRPDGQPMGIAGLWDCGRAGEGRTVR